MNIDHHHGDDILPNMTRVPHVKYITYYEDAESLPGWRTAVWELDKGVDLDFYFLYFYISCSIFTYTSHSAFQGCNGVPQKA
jgi:hypothetical protein